MDELPIISILPNSWKNKNVEEVKHGKIETWERQKEIITKLQTLQKSHPFIIVVSFIHWTTFSWSIIYHMFGYIFRLDSPPLWGSFYFLCKSAHPRQIIVQIQSHLKIMCDWFVYLIFLDNNGARIIKRKNDGMGLIMVYSPNMEWRCWFGSGVGCYNWKVWFFFFFFFLSLYDILLSLVVINVHLNLWFSFATLSPWNRRGIWLRTI